MTLRRAFIVDLNKCVGCHACEMACQIANAVPGALRWREVRTFNELHVHGVEVVHLSLACNHCAAAPCMEGCPARAFDRDSVTGAVLIDQDKCIGCRYCSWACPYGAPRFDEERGVMTKCDFCVEKQHSGGEPACATCCPTGALSWGELRDEELVHVAPGMADAGTDPSIRIVALELTRLAPRQTEPPAEPPWKTLADRKVPRITLAHEWALAVFTMLLSVLVGLFLASRLGAPAPNGGAFLGAGAAGLLLSASHLGRKTRAWRAGLHLDHSWLSREIVLFGAFLGLASLALLLGMPGTPGGRADLPRAVSWLDEARRALRWLGAPGWPAAAGWLAAALGVAALFATDRVYRVATVRGGGALHSAHVLGTGLLLAAAWSGAAIAAISLSALKATLYGVRKWKRRKLGLRVRGWATALRLGLLAAGVVFVWLGTPREAAFALLVAAELIDRAEYYDELEIPTPESLMLDELGSRPQAHGLSPKAPPLQPQR